MQHTDNVWPVYVSLKKVEKQVGRWSSVQWELGEVVPASCEQPADSKLVLLELHRDERASYRLNLDLDTPMLYLVCDELVDGTWVPAALSACQNVAAGALEGDTPVISMSMPDAVACWMEAFITRHGEVEICAHRRKHVNRRKELAADQRRKSL